MDDDNIIIIHIYYKGMITLCTALLQSDDQIAKTIRDKDTADKGPHTWKWVRGHGQGKSIYFH